MKNEDLSKVNESIDVLLQFLQNQNTEDIIEKLQPSEFAGKLFKLQEELTTIFNILRDDLNDQAGVIVKSLVGSAESQQIISTHELNWNLISNPQWKDVLKKNNNQTLFKYL